MVEAKSGPEPHPEGLDYEEEKFLLQLFDINAIKFGNFRLKLHEQHPEAPLSPVYFNLRMLPRVPDMKRFAVQEYVYLLKPLQFDLLAGVLNAAPPFVSSLSDRLNIGMITPRTDVKTHGTGARVDGLLPSDRGKTAVLVDDLVTGADSKLEAIHILEENGVKVQDVVVLIDREAGGKEQLAEYGYTLHAGFGMNQMLDFYTRAGKMNEDQLRDAKQRLGELNRFLRIT